MSKKKCQHFNFEVLNTVNRLKDSGRFNLDVLVKCDDCKLPFEFVGLPHGLDLNGPAMSMSGREARLAIKPGENIN